MARPDLGDTIRICAHGNYLLIHRTQFASHDCRSTSTLSASIATNHGVFASPDRRASEITEFFARCRSVDTCLIQSWHAFQRNDGRHAKVSGRVSRLSAVCCDVDSCQVGSHRLPISGGNPNLHRGRERSNRALTHGFPDVARFRAPWTSGRNRPKSSRSPASLDCA